MIISLKYADAREVAELVLQGVGVSTEHAALQVDLLLEAELRGHPSHGLLRLPRLVERIRNGVTSATATGVQTWRATSLLEVDGKDGLGPVVAMSALEEAIRQIAAAGVVVAAIRNNNHLGMLAWYAEKCQRRSKIRPVGGAKPGHLALQAGNVGRA